MLTVMGLTKCDRPNKDTTRRWPVPLRPFLPIRPEGHGGAEDQGRKERVSGTPGTGACFPLGACFLTLARGEGGTCGQLGRAGPFSAKCCLGEYDSCSLRVLGWGIQDGGRASGGTRGINSFISNMCA